MRTIYNEHQIKGSKQKVVLWQAYHRTSSIHGPLRGASGLTVVRRGLPGVGMGRGDGGDGGGVVGQGGGIIDYSVFIDTWSLRHLTSAEEYPDDEYLDMSKSSSLRKEEQIALLSK